MEPVCFFTAVCQEDEKHLTRYVSELHRLQVVTVMHFDRCDPAWAQRVVASSHRIIGSTSRNDEPFNEQHKQEMMGLLMRMNRFKWACDMDVDETWQQDWGAVLAALEQSTHDCIDVRWLNLWDDPAYIRVDGVFARGHRVKFYNLQEGRRWIFDHPITNGAKLQGRDGTTDKLWHLVSLHWGMLTREDRELHKKRWDALYSFALRGDPNPYGFWNAALDESSLCTIKHGYFQ